jgi:two-component system nitrate/nitrite response regulator NarL
LEEWAEGRRSVASRRQVIPIAVLGEDALARAGLAGGLGRERGLRVVAQFSPRDAREVAATPAHVILWDAGTAAQFTPEALDREFAIPVLALVLQARMAADALAAGVRGVLRRDAPPARIAGAVHALAAGLLVLDPVFAAALYPSRPERAQRIDPLTPRETEVLQHLVRGMSNKQIATALRISEHTAKFHINAVYSKLGVNGRTDAVVRAARLGLVIL